MTRRKIFSIFVLLLLVLLAGGLIAIGFYEPPAPTQSVTLELPRETFLPDTQ